MPAVTASAQASLVEANIKQHFPKLFASYAVLNEQLSNRIRQWQVASEDCLEHNDPFELYRQQLTKWKVKVETPDGFLINRNLITEYEGFCLFAKVPFDKAFWLKQYEIANKDSEKAMLASQLLCKEWQKKMDDALVVWQSEQLSRLGKTLLDELTDWLNAVASFVARMTNKSIAVDSWLTGMLSKLTGQNLQQMTQWCESLAEISQQLEALGLEPQIWLDSSLDELTPFGINVLQNWVSVLANDLAAQKIADILGRMRDAEWAEQISVVKQTIGISTPVVNINSKEEIIGLKLGKDLEHALPSELALMADPDTAILFDLKYLESKLLCFELQGTTFQDENIEIEVETKEQKEEAKGPMILCVDTSGSMQGEPEYIAKAMALYLGTKAKAENRLCYIVNFSEQIEIFEITGNKGIAALVAFLQRSFHGGTDAAPALIHTLKVLEQQQYSKADVLMISDFIMRSLPDSVITAIERQKQNGTRFNSLVIGNVFLKERLKTLFDKEWVYDAYTNNILELANFVKEINAINSGH